MNESIAQPEPISAERQKELLACARKLDRFGLQAEKFLQEQLTQLQLAIEEFERDKSAWRRQVRRETRHLEQQREEVEKLQQQVAGSPMAVQTTDTAAVEARKAARLGGDSPVQLLLQPHETTPSQVGLLMFEISKLNRELGGRGIEFSVTSVRAPRVGLLKRRNPVNPSSLIFELRGESALPLKARGRHVSLDVDVTDRIENWISFRAYLFQSSLKDTELQRDFSRGKHVPDDSERRAVFRQASQSMEHANAADFERSGYSSSAAFTHTPINSIAQQAERLEHCYERLAATCGLRIHVNMD